MLKNIEKYKIRHYQDDDEFKQSEIFNAVMKEIDDEFKEQTPSEIKQIYLEPWFEPSHVTYLIDEGNDIVGFCFFQLNGLKITINYPYILKMHRSETLCQKLFDTQFNEMKKLEANGKKYYKGAFIDSRHQMILNFFEKQNFVETQKLFLMDAPIEILNDFPKDYSIKPFKTIEIERVVVFYKQNENESMPGLKKSDLELAFKNNQIAEDQHIIIEKNGKIVGISGIEERITIENNKRIATIRFLDKEKNNNSFEIEQALLVGLRKAVIAKNAFFLRSGCYEKDPFVPLYEKLGFKIHKENFRKTFIF